jgi:3',5'-cyclic AMP phosphodiesterase CpdA
MKIAHVSDIHNAEAHFLPALAEKVVETLSKLEPELLIVTGDLTDEGYPTEFERAQRYIDRIPCKRRAVVPGNHDVRNLGYLGFEDFFGPRSWVEEYEGLRIVGLDSTQPDIDEGHVGRENYEWIEESLKTDEFKIVALHHHLLPVPKTGRERNILTDAGDLLELLMNCEVDLVLCGHKHVPWVWQLNEMIIANAGTACSNRVKWQIPQSFNLIDLDDAQELIRIYRLYSSGGQELIVKKRRNKR